MPQTYEPDLGTLIARARTLAASGRRSLLGICGAPGAGKSKLAAELVAETGVAAVLVPMDGFHLANAELEHLGRRDRKGAPDTFDAEAFVALLERLRTQVDDVVLAPVFRREIEEPQADAIAVQRATPLVITEGNYLLLDEGPWSSVRSLLDECWYIEGPEDERLRRLIARHIEFGKAPDEAHAWVHRSDEANARLIAATRPRADLIVRWPGSWRATGAGARCSRVSYDNWVERREEAARVKTPPFSSEIRYWNPEKASGLAVAEIPSEVIQVLGGLKQQRVIGTINGKAFTSNVMPAGGGRLALSVSKAMMTAAGVTVGADVALVIESTGRDQAG